MAVVWKMFVVAGNTHFCKLTADTFTESTNLS